MLFISHANPEDNELTRWLALQLAREGYPVWCDLTKLLGGENFWNDIQAALRERTIKFLFVLSRTSNSKTGPLNELELATKVARKDKLKDFIIPLWSDDLSTHEFDIRIGTIGAIRFQEGWAKGLHQLLKKLEEDAVPKKAGFNPAAVTSWWRQHVSAGLGIKEELEDLATNWYRIEPATLYFHELSRMGSGAIEIPSVLPYPGVRVNQYLVSFAQAPAFKDALGPGMSITSTATRVIGGSETEQGPRLWTFAEERQALSNLLRQAWLALIGARSMPSHEFANGSTAFYFRNEQLPDNRAWFRDAAGTRSWRAVVGYKTLKKAGQSTEVLRYWHFALEAKPTTSPILGYTMRPHVIFSDDGINIWESKDRLHRARRSQCRLWWNDRWRDLIASGVAWLAAEEGSICFPVGPSEALRVSAQPVRVTSPVTYVEPGQSPEDVGVLGDDTFDEADDELEEDAADATTEIRADGEHD